MSEVELKFISGHVHSFKYDETGRGECECGAVVQKLYQNGKITGTQVLKQGAPRFREKSAVPHPENEIKTEKSVTSTPTTPQVVKRAGKGTGWANVERHQYYLEHKTEIIADIKSKGVSETLKHWKIPFSTWGGKVGLAVQWGLEEYLIRKPRRKPKPVALTPVPAEIPVKLAEGIEKALSPDSKPPPVIHIDIHVDTDSILGILARILGYRQGGR